MRHLRVLLDSLLQERFGLPARKEKEQSRLLRVGVERSSVAEALSQRSGLLHKDLPIRRPGEQCHQTVLVESAHLLLVRQDLLFHVRSNGRQEVAVHRSFLSANARRVESQSPPFSSDNRYSAFPLFRFQRNKDNQVSTSTLQGN